MRFVYAVSTAIPLCLLPAMPPAQAAPACGSHDLAALVDARAGGLDGMSHAGTMLSLHNTGKAPCTLPARPSIGLLDDAAHPLPIAASATAGGTGHAATPTVDLPPGGDAEASLRWVSGHVHPRDRCLDATGLRVSLGDDTGLDAPLQARLCGPADAPLVLEQGDLRIAARR